MIKNVRIIKSNRRTVVLSVIDGVITVKAPLGYPDKKIDEFIVKKSNWINKRLVDYFNSKNVQKLTDEEIKTLRNETHILVTKYAEYYSKIMEVTYNRICVKKQKTLWGSCSNKGNLNFNLLLAQMPEMIVKYVVVHELAHLIEMNHSVRFWNVVKKFFPEYKQCVKWLKIEGKKYLNRI